MMYVEALSPRISVPVQIFKAWFSYVRKIPDNQGFYFLPIIPDFVDLLNIRQRLVPDFQETPC